MNETKALFQKIKVRDKRSFEALSDAYGWKLYSHIRSNTKEREQADDVFRRTFSEFYNSLQDYDGDDPIEAMLFSCADRITFESRTEDEIQPADLQHTLSLPIVDSSVYEKKQEPLWLKIFYSICIIVLILGILTAVWVMAWMLMSMNLIPQYDFGYSWFNLHIADLF